MRLAFDFGGRLRPGQAFSKYILFFSGSVLALLTLESGDHNAGLTLLGCMAAIAALILCRHITKKETPAPAHMEQILLLSAAVILSASASVHFYNEYFRAAVDGGDVPGFIRRLYNALPAGSPEGKRALLIAGVSLLGAAAVPGAYLLARGVFTGIRDLPDCGLHAQRPARTALWIWVVTFLTERLWVRDCNTVYLLSRLLLLAMLILFCRLLAGRWQNRSVAAADRFFFRFFFVYALLLLFILSLVWPGVWRADEFWVLLEAKDCHLQFWQGFLTSIYYILSMQLIPVPGGIVLVQVFLIAFLSAAAAADVYRRLQDGRWAWLLLAPLLFPSILDYNLYPMRNILYAYLELTFLRRVADCCMDGRTTKTDVLHFAVSVGILAAWRSEGVYYLLLGPAALALLLHKQIGRGWFLQLIALPMALALGLVGFQNLASRNDSHSDDYGITAYVMPVVPLIVAADAAGDTELLADANRVFDVPTTLRGAANGMNGEDLFWASGEDCFVAQDITSADLTAFQSAYVRLILRYPGVFLHERWSTLLASHDHVSDTANLYPIPGDPEAGTPLDAGILFINDPYGNAPISAALRKTVLCMLEGRRLHGDERDATWVRPVFYSVLPPLLLLMAELVIALCLRRWRVALLLALPLCKAPLIFLTAPGTYFLYYYPLYVLGYLSAAGFAAILCANGRLLLSGSPDAPPLTAALEENSHARAKWMPGNLFKTFLKFFGLSGIGWIIDFCVYLLLTEALHIPAGIANACSAVPAVTFVFFMSTRYAFQKRASRVPLWAKYLLYVLYQVLLVGGVSMLNQAISDAVAAAAWMPSALIALRNVLSKALITPITMLLNFVVLKRLIERI